MGIKKEIPLFSLGRAKILAVLKKYEPLSIEDLSKKSGMSRASVYNHLRTLKKKNLVKEKQELDKLGQPIFITRDANPVSLPVLKMFEKIFPEQFK